MIQQKQNYPDSVAFYDSQPESEMGLFYNGPEHHTGWEKRGEGREGRKTEEKGF